MNILRNLTPRTRLLASLLILLLLAALAWGIYLGFHAYRLNSNLDEIQELASKDLADIEPDDAGPLLVTTARDLSALRNGLAPLYPLFGALDFLPGIGPRLAQLEPQLDYAAAMARSGVHLGLVLSPLLDLDLFDGEPTSQQSGLYLYQALQRRRGQLVQAGQALDMAAAARSRLDPSLLPQRAVGIFSRIDPRFPTLRHGVALLGVLPDLLGPPGDSQTYLILAQNRDELRATGGFISAIGVAQVAEGQIVEFEMADSYDLDDFSVDYPPPPEPLQRFMLAGYWLLRDANWSPDFPSAAQQAQSLYTLSTGVPTHGVIAFDQSTVRAILRALGPVQVPEFPEAVTAENVEYLMQQAWAPSPEQGLSQVWHEQRKDFIPLMGRALLHAMLTTTDRQTLMALGAELFSSLEEGHLLVYFNHDEAQSALRQAGWDGGLHPEESDFLLLVDSNIGFNKVDSAVRRSLSYHIDLTNVLEPRGVIEVRYTNTVSADVPCQHEASYGSGTYTDLQQRCYWDYWRLYRPQGSQLLAASVPPVPAERLLSQTEWPGQVESESGEAGATVFSGLLVLPTASEQVIRLESTIPSQALEVVNGLDLRYTLRIQVQPGLGALPVALSVAVPAGYTLPPPEGWQAEAGGIWTWEGTLTQTTDLTILLTPSGE